MDDVVNCRFIDIYGIFFLYVILTYVIIGKKEVVILGRKKGKEDPGNPSGLVKITTYIPLEDREYIRILCLDGSKMSEHYRRAIKMYIQKMKRERRI